MCDCVQYGCGGESTMQYCGSESTMQYCGRRKRRVIRRAIRKVVRKVKRIKHTKSKRAGKMAKHAPARNPKTGRFIKRRRTC